MTELFEPLAALSLRHALEDATTGLRGGAVPRDRLASVLDQLARGFSAAVRGAGMVRGSVVATQPGDREALTCHAALHRVLAPTLGTDLEDRVVEAATVTTAERFGMRVDDASLERTLGVLDALLLDLSARDLMRPLGPQVGQQLLLVA